MATQDQDFVTTSGGRIRPVVAIGQNAVGTTMSTQQTTLTTSAKSVLSASTTRIFAEIKNLDAAIIIYIGQTNAVTASTGYPLKPGEAFDLEGYTGAVFAVAASGTPAIATVDW